MTHATKRTPGVLTLVSLLAVGCPTGPAAEPEAVACDPGIGAVEPLRTCSISAPCEALPGTDSRTTIEVPVERPLCATSDPERPLWDDGAAREWADGEGTSHYACEYRPAGTSAELPRPLLIFLHGAYGSADNVYDATSLRSKATSFDLSGDPARPGFILLSIQGRNLHWPTADPRDGAHHDIFHRDLGSPSGNPDIAHLDQRIDTLADEGVVDEDRIYLTGWSNGGFFAQLVAIARHETPTPGGRRVAAAAVFSAADPFHEARVGQEPSCRLDPYPTSGVPLRIVGRSCDLVACDSDQAEALADSGVEVAPGAVVGTWLEDLEARVGDDQASRRIIDAYGDTVAECTAPSWCGPATATLNHLRWPDGVADGSGQDHEGEMLAFLRDHPAS